MSAEARARDAHEKTATYFVEGQPFGVRVLQTFMAQCPKCRRWCTLPHTIAFEEEGPTVTGENDMVQCGYSECRCLFEIKKGIGRLYG